jgi:hypothetical protein
MNFPTKRHWRDSSRMDIDRETHQEMFIGVPEHLGTDGEEASTK